MLSNINEGLVCLQTTRKSGLLMCLGDSVGVFLYRVFPASSGGRALPLGGSSPASPGERLCSQRRILRLQEMLLCVHTAVGDVAAGLCKRRSHPTSVGPF